MFKWNAENIVLETLHNAKINIPFTRRLDCKTADNSFNLFVDLRVEIRRKYDLLFHQGIPCVINEFYGNENIVYMLTIEGDGYVKQISVIRKPEAKYITLYLKIFE